MIGFIVMFICMCFRWFFISIYEVYNKVKEKEFFVVWNKLGILLWFLFLLKDNCWIMNYLFFGGGKGERERFIVLYIY